MMERKNLSFALLLFIIVAFEEPIACQTTYSRLWWQGGKRYQLSDNDVIKRFWETYRNLLEAVQECELQSWRQNRQMCPEISLASLLNRQDRKLKKPLLEKTFKHKPLHEVASGKVL